MKTILAAVYGLAALFAFICGRVYSQVEIWSYLVAASCALHLALALIISAVDLVGAARIVAWFWQGVSALIVAAMLLAYTPVSGSGWLLASVGLAMFTGLVTLVLALTLRAGGAAGFNRVVGGGEGKAD